MVAGKKCCLNSIVDIKENYENYYIFYSILEYRMLEFNNSLVLKKNLKPSLFRRRAITGIVKKIDFVYRVSG